MDEAEITVCLAADMVLAITHAVRYYLIEVLRSRSRVELHLSWPDPEALPGGVGDRLSRQREPGRDQRSREPSE